MPNNYITLQKQFIKKIRASLSKDKFKATVVEPQKDYENDNQICLTSSASIPKNISYKIVKKIITPLKNIDPVHFYFRPELMHLTIKNIRTIHQPPLFTNADVIKVDKLFKELIPLFPSLNFYLEDLVLFPTSISLIGYCDEGFKKLVRALDSGLKKIGVPDDKKYFSNTIFFSNITLCRFAHKLTTPFIEKAKELQNIKIGNLRVKKINLISGNAVYNPKMKKIIAEYQLKND